jgi:hypothetical protein
MTGLISHSTGAALNVGGGAGSAFVSAGERSRVAGVVGLVRAPGKATAGGFGFSITLGDKGFAATAGGGARFSTGGGVAGSGTEETGATFGACGGSWADSTGEAADAGVGAVSATGAAALNCSTNATCLRSGE